MISTYHYYSSMQAHLTLQDKLPPKLSVLKQVIYFAHGSAVLRRTG